MAKRTSLLLLSLILIAGITFFPLSMGATGKASDIAGHWANAQLNEWLSENLVKGDPDGAIRADDPISRAEFIALANRAFGWKEEGAVGFSDVKQSDWFYRDAAIAVKAGYLSGQSDGRMNPGKRISRQEVAVMISRILGLEAADSEAASTYKDAGSIAVWSMNAVSAMTSSRIMTGNNDRFRPLAPISRAEAIVALDRARKLDSRSYAKAGVYGPAAGTVTAEGDVAIRVPGVTLRNTIVTGNLVLEEGIGAGDASLSGVTVKGSTTIRGGGANSIHVQNTVLGNVLIHKKNKERSPVRVVFKGSSRWGTIVAKSSAIIEIDTEKPSGNGEILLPPELPEGSEITLRGDFELVEVQSRNILVRIERGSVKRLTIAAGAADNTLDLSEGAVVENMEKSAAIKVTGAGKILRIDDKTAAAGAGGVPGPTATHPNTTTSDLNIVTSGQANAVILTAADADARTLEAAETLSEYVRQSTGAQLPIHSVGESNVPANAVKIYVGTAESQDRQEVDGLLQGLSNDGFVILPKADRITIEGPTIWGTEFGVYDFLERFVGVAWLMPGPDGEDVPAHSSISVPVSTVREQPATISRHFFGTEDPPLQMGSAYPGAATTKEWAKRNRMYDNIRFHHNLTHLFDPAVFADHPEYYPGGVLPSHPYLWQVCFNDDTANAAIARIKEYFAAHPDETSYSLGLNDGANFCEADPNHPNYPGKTNSVGELDMSELYYPWVNQIVEGVLAEYPDKYFGLLAYANVYDPPENFTLNDHVVPYITDDRMTWIDPDMGIAGKLQTEKWSAVAANIGWYEYLYGSPFNLPRVYPHEMAENYEYAQQQGVIGHVAELFPNFGEGPKPWLSAKLQWDPGQDVDELMNDWYTRAVGTASAPYLKQYYEMWESFWTTRIFQTDWYLNWRDAPKRTNHLPGIYDASYLKAVTKEEIAESRRLMELVVANAQTSQQHKRAELLMLAFEYYEASALSYPQDTAITALETDEEAEDLFMESVTSMVYAQKRMDLVSQFIGHPILDFQLAPPTFGGMWSGLQDGVFDALADWTEQAPDGGAFESKLVEMSDSETTTVSNYASLLLAMKNGSQNLLQDPSFEIGGDGSNQATWWYWTEGTGSMTRTDQIKRTGTYSIEIDGVRTGGGPVQSNVPVKPGYYAAIVRYYTPPGFDPDSKASIQWWLNLQGSGNQHLASAVTAKIPVAPNRGKWSTLEVLFEAKEGVNTAQMVFPVWDLQSGEKIYIDDVALYRLDGSVTVSQTGSGDGYYVSDGHPLGQTFRTPSGTGWNSLDVELFIDGSNWTSGTTLTLSLYDDPDKTTLLGSAAIDGPVQGYFHRFKIAAPTAGNTGYYVELTSNSPANVGWVVASPNDAYVDGQAYQDGSATVKDLYFNAFLSK